MLVMQIYAKVWLRKIIVRADGTHGNDGGQKR